MPTHCLSRQLFNYRLNLFVAKGLKSQTGFIPDVLNLLVKYGLFDYIKSYLTNACFPSKSTWKRIVSKAIWQYHTQARINRMQADQDFNRFNAVHCSSGPLALWLSAKTSPEIIHAVSAVNVLVKQSHTG